MWRNMCAVDAPPPKKESLDSEITLKTQMVPQKMALLTLEENIQWILLVIILISIHPSLFWIWVVVAAD